MTDLFLFLIVVMLAVITGCMLYLLFMIRTATSLLRTTTRLVQNIWLVFKWY